MQQYRCLHAALSPAFEWHCLLSPRGSGGFGVLQQHGSMPPELGSADILRLTQPHPNMSYPLLTHATWRRSHSTTVRAHPERSRSPQ